MAVEVTVDYDHFREYERETEAAINRALQDGAAEIVGTAQQIVPVDRGFLRRSIRMDPVPVNGYYIVKAGGIPLPEGGIVDYEEHVEKGTRYMAAQPYMRPAYERHQAGIKRACEAAISRHT